MTLAQFVVILAVALTAIAVALIVAAVILMEKELEGGKAEAKKQAIAGGALQLPEGYAGEIRWRYAINWTPVEERLPDNWRKVLVSVNISKGVDAVGISHWDGHAWPGAIVGTVVAWAELPDPYKK